MIYIWNDKFFSICWLFRYSWKSRWYRWTMVLKKIILISNYPLIILSRMPHTTLCTTRTVSILARPNFVIYRVILLFFPSMTFTTEWLKWTCFFISRYKGSSLPKFTQKLAIIVKQMRFASKILPVMCIYALGFIMLTVCWAPFRLEIVHVKVGVSLHLVYESGFYIKVCVSKWAKVAILTTLR